MDFTPAISALNDELIALRRDFHRHPEIGFQEVRTSKIVEDYLTELGLEVRRRRKQSPATTASMEFGRS